MPPILFLALLAILAIINLWMTFKFWSDKRSAILGRRRVPEADLLFLALIGGSPAALLSRGWFRHKTRKEPFNTRLQVIVFLQIGTGIGLILFDTPLNQLLPLG